jgi:peptidoglycan/LPS O-acetylase OafA/YrhL
MSRRCNCDEQGILSGREPIMQARQLKGLDGIRAIAIAMVLGTHLIHTRGFPEAKWLHQLLSPGTEGVTIFFVLSGFLITWLLLEEEKRSGTICLRRFFVRRAFRILPAAFFFLGFLALVGPLLGTKVIGRQLFASALFFRNVASNASGVVEDSHFWTLAIEEQFYLVWPLVFLMCRSKVRIGVAAGLVLFAPLWRQFCMEVWGGGNLNWFRTDLRYDPLLVGCLAALLREKFSPNSALFGDSIGRKNVILLTATLIFVVLTWLWSPPGWLIQATMTAKFMAIALGILVCVELPSGLVATALNCWPVMILGQMSYSLYLWQQLFSLNINDRWFQVFPVNLVLTAACGCFSFFVVERFFLRIRERWFRSQSAKVG